MATTPILNLPIAVGLDGTEWAPIVQAGVTSRAQTQTIANLANGSFIPSSATLTTNQGIQGGGLLSSNLTISLSVNGITAASDMEASDSFAINDVSAGNLSRKVTFTNAMKAINTLSASPALNLTADKFVVYRAADGLTYSATASQISLAAGNVPAGGTTAQVLAKASNADYDTVWQSSAFADQAANLVFAGPASGGAVQPAFRALVGADLPNPAASTKGGVQSYAAVSNQFLTQISTSGVVSSAQPAFSNLSGNATVAQGGTGLTTTTPYALFAAGTTATGNFQQVSGLGTSGQLLTSTGPGGLPTWQSATASIGQALTKGDDTNVTLTLGGAPTTALLSATSITAGWTGQLSLARGGTNANLTASNGGLFYSTGSAGAILAGTATSGQIPRSGASAAPSWSTATYPATTAAGQVLTSGTANTIAGSSSPTLGIPGTTAGGIAFAGATSGTATIATQAAAGTPTLTLPTGSGTFGVSGTAPITVNSTTGAIGVTAAALTKTDDTNVTLTLGGTPASALLAATSLTLGWTGQLALTRGGTNASLAASNGGIVYSTASAMGILSGTATANQILMSGSSTTPAWSTNTYPATAVAGSMLNAGTANTITATITPTLGVQQTSRGTLTLANTAAGAFAATLQSSNSATAATTITLPPDAGANGQVLQTNGSGVTSWTSVGGTGTVTSVSFTGGLISVATATTTPALTVAGTSGGIPYFSSTSTWASSAALAANAIVLGGGAGSAPATTATGTGVVTALGVNVGSSGAFVVNGGALGTPASGTLSNCSGLPVAGITSSTSTALGVGSLEVGNASDTTISRDSAGVIAVEGVPLYSGIPQNSQSAAYTTVLADAQKHILHPTADNNARTFTIAANASVAYPIGTCITFVNQINVVTIAINTDTLTWAGPGTTGSRSLAAGGMATAMKITSTLWFISGVGLS